MRNIPATPRQVHTAITGINHSTSRQDNTHKDEMSLPNSIQISKAPKYSSWSRTKEYHIGTADAPLYTCKEVISWSGKFTLDLYSGSTTNGTSVANSTSGSLRKNEAVITIPVASQSYDNQGYGEISEPFRRHVTLKHET